LRWARSLLLGAIVSIVTLVFVAAVGSNGLVPGPLVQPLALAAGTAAFVYVATLTAPVSRSVPVSLGFSLLPLVASAAMFWQFPQTRAGVVPGTLLGASCAVVLLHRNRLRSAARSVPALAIPQQPVQETGDQAPAIKPVSAIEPRISEGIVLALISVASYALAFAYEVGFGSPYHVPPALITLNLTTGFVAAAAGASALMLFYAAISGLVNSLPPSVIPSAVEIRRFTEALTVALPLLFALIASGFNLVIVVLAGTFFLVLPKLPVARAVHPQTLMRLFFERFSIRTLAPLVLFAYLLMIAFVLGRHQALAEPQFIFDKDDKQYIVLRIYGDNIITAAYAPTLSDPGTWVVGRGLRFFKVGDKDTPEFTTKPDYTRLSIPHKRLVGQNPWRDWLYPYE
jgi:hypothetical protein